MKNKIINIAIIIRNKTNKTWNNYMTHPHEKI